MFRLFKSIFVKPPPVTLLHSQLGLLTREGDDIWSGLINVQDRVVRIFIVGDAEGPDEELVKTLTCLRGRFTAVEQSALAFILSCVSQGDDRRELELYRKTSEVVTREDFNFYSLGMLWEDEPNDYVFEFLLAGDPDGVWRVEFVDGCPTSLGRDD